MNITGIGAVTRWKLHAVALQLGPDFHSGHRFQHKNPEDPVEVPGGFLSDLNPVGSWSVSRGWWASELYIAT